jgi:hypothetical protein
VTAEQAPKVATLFVQENARHGVILAGGLFFNTAHDDVEALDRTEAAVRASFAVIADGLQRDCLDDLIECEMVEESFRRLVT